MIKVMSELRKFKAQRGVEDTLNAENSPNIIQILSLALSLGSKV